MPRATAIAGANIALVKYWGNLDEDLRLPRNPSLSMTLNGAETRTTVVFRADLASDALHLNGKAAREGTLRRASEHLDRIRALAGIETRAEIASENSFPTGAGIASSASGFAALTAAACAALGLDLPPVELSKLARMASGSACRSIFGGFVEWVSGGRHADSYAQPIAPPDHWNLVDLVAVISKAEKDISSTRGHALAPTSPLYAARLAELQTTLPRIRAAIFERNFLALGELIEAEALSLHAVMMTSARSILYWEPGTLAVIHALRRWRSEVQAYFTIDAGPNVHVITPRTQAESVRARLEQIPEVQDVIACGVGEGVRLSDAHLL